MEAKIIRLHGGFGEDDKVINATVETFDKKGRSKLESVQYFRPKKPKRRILTPEN